MFPVKFNANTGSPDQLEKMLNARRSAAAPTNTPASNALKLMSQAQLAFDRGQYNDALAFVQDAEKLNAPVETFNSSVQPWQLKLNINKAMASAAKIDPAVRQTSLIDGDNTGSVATADYRPETDKTKNVSVGFNDDTNGISSPAAKIPSTSIEMYRAGLEAIRVGNTAEAKNYMHRAWQNRETLDEVTKQSLQDQLLKLSQRDKSLTNYATQATQNQPVQRNLQEQDVATFRDLQRQVIRERASAERLIEKSPREALEKMAMIRGRIGQSNLDAKQQRPLLIMMDRDMAEVQAYIDQNLSTIENEETNTSRKELVERRRQRRSGR